MASPSWVSVGPVATADPGEAARLLDDVERELGVPTRPDPATTGRRTFTLDARDAFEARELVAAALGRSIRAGKASSTSPSKTRLGAKLRQARVITPPRAGPNRGAKRRARAECAYNACCARRL